MGNGNDYVVSMWDVEQDEMGSIPALGGNSGVTKGNAHLLA